MLSRMKAIAIALLVVALIVPTVSARNYVSLNGGFFVTYPDDWEQLDYVTVDAFLARRGVEAEMFEYDAVLAPSASSPFFAGDYVIITVDTVGELTEHQIDSVLSQMRDDFGAGITFQETDEFMVDITPDKPCYDKTTKTFAVLNEIQHGEDVTKQNLVMMKFYEKGIVSFFFYSPDSLFKTSTQTFQDIVTSFNTENIEAALPSEELKVADIKTDESGNLEPESSRTTLYLSIAVFILLGIVIIYLVRAKK